MELANKLGFVHVDEMLDQMSPEEFMERLAYYRISGEGQARRLIAAVMAKIEFEVSRYIVAKTGGGKIPPIDPEDFLPPAFRVKTKSRERRLNANDPDAAEKFAKMLGLNPNGR